MTHKWIRYLMLLTVVMVLLSSTTVFADVGYTIPTTSNSSIRQKVEEIVVPKDGILKEKKEALDNKINKQIEKIDKQTDEVLNKKLNWFERKIFELSSKSIGGTFKIISGLIVNLPVVLIYNPGIIALYVKFMIIGCVLMPIILMFQYMKTLISDDYVVLPLPIAFFDIIKSTIFMFGFSIILPRIIIIINLITQAILSMGYSQLEFNTYLNMLSSNSGISALGLALAVVMVITILVFLAIIFVITSIRYWDLCQLFVTAPIAFSMMVSSKTRFYYYGWRDDIKQVLIAQLMYAIHLLIFAGVLSNPLPGITDASLVKIMLLIGGIFRMIKIPGGLRDILSKGNNEESVKSFAKNIFGAATSPTKVPKGGKK